MDRREADLMICFDTTASMNDIIRALIQQTRVFVTEAESLGVGLRWGLVAFGDIRVQGDKIVRYPFTSDSRKFNDALKSVPRFGGGANRGETSLDALATVAGHPGWRPAIPHICVLITDEPPVGVNVDLESVGRQLRHSSVVTFSVAPDHKAYRWLAQVTGGQWWSIDDEIPYDQVLATVAQRVALTAATLPLALGSNVQSAPKGPLA